MSKNLTYAEIDALIDEARTAGAEGVPWRTARRLMDAVLMLRTRLYTYELSTSGALDVIGSAHDVVVNAGPSNPKGLCHHCGGSGCEAKSA